MPPGPGLSFLHRRCTASAQVSGGAADGPQDRPQAVRRVVHSNTRARPHPVHSVVHRVWGTLVDGGPRRLVASFARSPPALRARSQGEGERTRSPGGSVVSGVRLPAVIHGEVEVGRRRRSTSNSAWITQGTRVAASCGAGRTAERSRYSPVNTA